MKGIYFSVLLAFVIIAIFFPVIIQGKIPFSANYLVSFYNPWSKESNLGIHIPNKPVGNDDLVIFYPQRYFTNALLSIKNLPSWNPYNYSGNYHIGLSETAVFYPFFLLSLITPQIFAWTILIVLEPTLAAVGMYLYLRLLLSNHKSAVFGGIVFGFSGLMLVRMVEGISVGHTFLWLPFILYGIEGYVQKSKIRYLIIMLLALTLSLLAGWFQYTFYITCFSFIYCIFRTTPISFSKKLLVFTPFFILPFITLYHILPALQAYGESLRSTGLSSYIQGRYLMPIQHIVTFIFPDFWGNPAVYNFFGKSEYKESIMYIGVVPFVFACLSALSYKNMYVRFFSITAIVTTLLGIYILPTRLLLSLPIPLVSSFLPDRIFCLTVFSLSVLAAYGLDLFLAEKVFVTTKKIGVILSCIAFLVICVDMYFISVKILMFFIQKNANKIILIQIKNFLLYLGNANETQFLIQLRNSIIPQVFLVVIFFVIILWKKKIIKRLFLPVFILTLLGQMYFAQKFIPFSQSSFLYPHNEVFDALRQKQGMNRFVSTQEGHLEANIPLLFRLYSPDGDASMYPKYYANLISYIDKKNKTTFASRITVRVAPTSKNLFAQENFYLLRFMQIDGIAYVLKLKKEKDIRDGFFTEGTKKFTLAWENNTWQIFHYTNQLPRYFWTDQYEVIPDETNVLNRLFDPSFNPHTLIFQEYPGKTKPTTPRSGQIKLLSYAPNESVFHVSAKHAGFLYFSDTFSPSIQAFVDGKIVPLLRADYSFRAVPLPPGEHTVRMSFNNSYIFIGFIISFITIIFLCMGIWISIRKKYIKW